MTLSVVFLVVAYKLDRFRVDFWGLGGTAQDCHNPPDLRFGGFRSCFLFLGKFKLGLVMACCFFKVKAEAKTHAVASTVRL